MADLYPSLVLCFDGTWNTEKSHTNVSRLYSEIADDATGCPTQHKFYDQGVGTAAGVRVRGGMFGYGLDQNIRDGYAWLASMYRCDVRTLTAGQARTRAGAKQDPGQTPPRVEKAPVAGIRARNGDLTTTPPHSTGLDFLVGSDLYLIGFSRGAFTARSLGGLINYLGIPDLKRAKLDKNIDKLADQRIVQQAWALYVARPSSDERASVDRATVAKVQKHDDDVAAYRSAFMFFPVRIHFVGVWDTVGALGIPSVAWWPRSSTFAFHDTTLSEGIRNAFHAVAIDEHRNEYDATLWSRAAATTEAIEQRWFPGAHADVGGGYEDDLLPAAPLRWIAERAALCGLEFVGKGGAGTTSPYVPRAFDLIGTEYTSPVHDSYAEFGKGLYQYVQMLPGLPGKRYRRMMVKADGANQSVDETAFQKWKSDPEYRPVNLGQAGRQDVTFAMAADLAAAVRGAAT